MKVRISTEEIQDRINVLKSRGITLISPFVGTNIHHDFSCDICNHVWHTKFCMIYSAGSGCPKCSLNTIKVDKLAAKLAEFEARNIQMLEAYVTAKTKTRFLCRNHNIEWLATFDNVSQGKGCPQCKIEKISKGRQLKNDELFDRLQSMLDRKIRLRSPYTLASKKHEFDCLADGCGHIWSAIFNNVHYGSGCPKWSGRYVSPEDQIKSEARFLIRSRLSSLAKCTGIRKPYRCEDGQYNELADYFVIQYEQFIKSNPRIENYELDHILPLDIFDPFDLEQMKICWDSRNLQWLSKTVNVSKGSSLQHQYFNDWHYQILDKLGIK